MRARAGAIGFSGPCRQQRRKDSVRRREGAAAARPGDLRRAASRHPRRADQPSRHRQPRRPDRGDQRLSRRGDPGVARPLSAGGLRRPAVAGARRQGDAVRRRPRRLPAPGAVRREPGHYGRSNITGAGSGTSPPRRRREARRNRAAAQAGIQAELAIMQLTRQLQKLDATLADGDLFARDPARAAELRRRAPMSLLDRQGGRGMAGRQQRAGNCVTRLLHVDALVVAVFGARWLLFRRGLGGLRLLGRAVNYLQAAVGEGVDAGPRAARDKSARPCARLCRRRRWRRCWAGQRGHGLAFGHAERDAAGHHWTGRGRLQSLRSRDRRTLLLQPASVRQRDRPRLSPTGRSAPAAGQAPVRALALARPSALRSVRPR